MRPIELINLSGLMAATEGEDRVTIGLIDGPISLNHPDFTGALLRGVPGKESSVCTDGPSIACQHGTFIASMLCARRGSAAVGICPGCTVLVRPVFPESACATEALPSTTPELLAEAMLEVMDAGANIINLSSAIAKPSSRPERALEEVLDTAARRGVLIIAAAGNQGTVGSTAITRHRWVIPVVGCDLTGRPIRESNISGTIGRSGVRAPGDAIVGLNTTGGTVTLSGTSIAAPFVTGTVALLWSLFPGASASLVRASITGASRRRSVVPPMLDASGAHEFLKALGTHH